MNRHRPARPATATPDRGGQAGVALVEFALVAPLLVFFCLGTVDLGRAFVTANQARNAAREAAAYAQLHPTRLAGVGCTDPGSAQWHALNETGVQSGFTVAVTTPSGTYRSTDAGCGPPTVTAPSGQTITVTVSRTMPLLTSPLRAFLGTPTISASVSVRAQ